jgi:hypothetical protein
MDIRATLEPLADWFNSLGIPEPITHWGHPAMMGIVVFVMGFYMAIAGWKGRTAMDGEVAQENKAMHAKLAPLVFLFIALGYTGGILSLVMQGQPIFESPHFWTGTLVIGLFAINGLIAATKFGGEGGALRSAHAFIGSAAMLLLVGHAALGVKLGLSI